MDGPTYISFASPLGPLTLFADGGALSVLETGRAPDPDCPAPQLLHEARRQLDAYFDGKLDRFDLPLAPTGPPRRREIWTAMAEIPYGRTETYGALAKRIGSSARAVGGACAANPLPIFIPCHRVLGAGDRLAGYSFAAGPESKHRLLTLENVELVG